MAKCKKFDDGFLSTIYEYDVNDVVSLDMVKSINCEIGFQHGPLYTDCNIEICHRLGDDKYIGRQIRWENHEEGELLFEFGDDTDLWSTLKIGGRHIGGVLESPYIAERD